MDALLSMPLSMSTALMVLFAIAAFLFIKAIAMSFDPASSRLAHPAKRRQTVRVSTQVQTATIGNRQQTAQRMGRRASDHDWSIAN
jgi:hypothetical protein